MTTSTAISGLTLVVTVPGTADTEVFVQHGITVGRSVTNAVCVDDPAVDRVHATVLRQPDGSMNLECHGSQTTILLTDGTTARTVKLLPNVAFKIGPAVFQCRQPREARGDGARTPWTDHCPFCDAKVDPPTTDVTAKCHHCQAKIGYLTAADGFRGWLPRQVGPFKVLAFVAQGGMSVVVRGIVEKYDSAALKLIRGSDGDRFEAELEILRQLRHPNVVRLQDSGSSGRLRWLAMDWVDGRPLSHLIEAAVSQKKFVAIEGVQDLMRQVVNGLTYLHSKTVIHRDLKPGNILVGKDNGVKVADFGIAKGGAGLMDRTRTRTGQVVGTAVYISPEQAAGRPATSASDVYSLGVIWYELLTGRPAVGAPTAPSQVRGDVPDVWSSMVMRCLSYNPMERPPLPAIAAALALAIPKRAGKPGSPPPIPPQTGWAPPRPIEPPGGWSPTEDILPGAGPTEPPPLKGARQRQTTGADYRLFPIGSIIFSVLIGGSLSWGLLSAANLFKLGKPLMGLCTILAGIAFIAGAVLVGTRVSIPVEMLSVAGIWILQLVASLMMFGRHYEEHQTRGGRFQSGWASVGLTFLGLVLGVGVAVGTAAADAARSYTPEEEFRKGMACQMGTGVPVDYDQARRWYVKAVDGGNPLAMNNLGKMLADGQGGPRDPAQAVNLYREAADLGVPVGALNLANCYRDGSGVGKDSKEAARWYRTAADKGNGEAMRLLGDAYASGDGVTASPSDAADWHQKAAIAGDITGMFDYAHACHDGIGTAKDMAAAQKWYREAADGGNCDAMNNLGVMYETGDATEGVRHDKAFEWYTQAAKAGSAAAQCNLGDLYKTGRTGVVEQNRETAIEWYKKAVASGSTEAKKRLETYDK